MSAGPYRDLSIGEAKWYRKRARITKPLHLGGLAEEYVPGTSRPYIGRWYAARHRQDQTGAARTTVDEVFDR